MSESTHSPTELGVPSEPAGAPREQGHWVIYCVECAKVRDVTGKADGWLIVWRHDCSVVTSIRPWDQTVAAIPDRPSFCSWQCALPKLIKLGREAQVLDSVEI